MRRIYSLVILSGKMHCVASIGSIVAFLPLDLSGKIYCELVNMVSLDLMRHKLEERVIYVSGHGVTELRGCGCNCLVGLWISPALKYCFTD